MVRILEFLLLVDLVLLVQNPHAQADLFKSFRSYCLSGPCYNDHMLKSTGSCCLSSLAESSLLRDLVGTGNVRDSNIVHHGHRPSRFIWVTPTGVMATDPAIMLVMRLHGRFSSAS